MIGQGVFDYCEVCGIRDDSVSYRDAFGMNLCDGDYGDKIKNDDEQLPWEDGFE